METHYVCTGGCQGVADTPGTCQAADCKDYQQDLKACSCADGQHAEAASDSAEE